jgi:SAM-dependent methyltransferase
MWQFAKRIMLSVAPELLYPTPTSSLQPERLYAYLDALWQRRELDGAILEIGCFLGGTAAIAERMLRRAGHQKRYVCVDTFGGFVPEQFDRDVKLGTPPRLASLFDMNSPDAVARLLRRWGAEVELVQGDIAVVPDARLPDKVAACLLDVDLELPTLEGLRRVWPRLVPGGVIVVDDCPEETDWVGARIGYERFVAELSQNPEYFLGLGIVRHGDA